MTKNVDFLITKLRRNDEMKVASEREKRISIIKKEIMRDKSQGKFNIVIVWDETR